MASTLQPLDLYKQARYPVSFAGEKRQYASIQYNHKPQQTSQKRKTILKPSDDSPESFQLSIRDTNDGGGSQELYKYKGQSSSSGKDVYAVLLDPQTRKCVLAPVGSQYTFNLTSTPKEKDIAKLQQQYEQLKPDTATISSSDGEDDLFGDAEEQPSEDGSDAEPSFFDWRNFLPRGRSTSPDHPGDTLQSRAVSTQNTPLLGAQSARSSLPSKPKPQSRPQNESAAKTKSHRDVFKPRKQVVSPLVAPTRKPAPIPARRKTSKVSTPTTLPGIRVKDDASTREDTIPEHTADDQQPSDAKPKHSPIEANNDSDIGDHADDDSDSDDLVLDFDAPTRPSARAHAFGLATASAGPISLRSAASSPGGSRLSSPALRQQQPASIPSGGRNDEDEDEDDDEDMGLGLEIEVPDGGMRYTFDDDDEEGGADSDVDALELPSPAAAAARREGRQLSPPDEMEEDENVDLEAEMLQALDEDEDEGDVGGVAGTVVQEESESESEAE